MGCIFCQRLFFLMIHSFDMVLSTGQCCKRFSTYTAYNISLIHILLSWLSNLSETDLDQLCFWWDIGYVAPQLSLHPPRSDSSWLCHPEISGMLPMFADTSPFVMHSQYLLMMLMLLQSYLVICPSLMSHCLSPLLVFVLRTNLICYICKHLTKISKFINILKRLKQTDVKDFLKCLKLKITIYFST